MTNSDWPCFKCKGEGVIYHEDHCADGHPDYWTEVCDKCNGKGKVSMSEVLRRLNMDQAKFYQTARMEGR